MAINCDNLKKAGDNSPSVIRWPETRKLAELCDAAAASLGTPGYVPLLTDNHTPFPSPDLHPQDFRVRFNLNPPPHPDAPYPEVIDNDLLEAGSLDRPLVLPEPYRTLAEAGELYFLHEQDECWCKSLFKIVMQGGALRLETVKEPNFNCGCQGIRVPEARDLLNESQKMVPVGAALTWGYRTSTARPDRVFWDQGQRCVGDQTQGMNYMFRDMADDTQPPSTNYFMKYALRDMSGKLVWAVRRKWYQTIKERVDYIIACAHSCGAADSKVWKNGTGTYVPTGCAVTFEDLQWTLQKDWYPVGVPGCMSDPGKLPWNEATCTGSLKCGAMPDGGAQGNDFPGGQAVGPRAADDWLVYCTTLVQFEKLLELLPSQILPPGACAAFQSGLWTDNEYCDWWTDTWKVGPTVCNMKVTAIPDQPVAGGLTFKLELLGDAQWRFVPFLLLGDCMKVIHATFLYNLCGHFSSVRMHGSVGVWNWGQINSGPSSHRTLLTVGITASPGTFFNVLDEEHSLTGSVANDWGVGTNCGALETHTFDVSADMPPGDNCQPLNVFLWYQGQACFTPGDTSISWCTSHPNDSWTVVDTMELYIEFIP